MFNLNFKSIFCFLKEEVDAVDTEKHRDYQTIDNLHCHEFLNLQYLQSISDIRTREFYTAWYDGERHLEEPKYVKKYSAELTFIDKTYYLISNKAEDIEEAITVILDKMKELKGE